MLSIKGLLELPEGKTLEFKENLSSLKPIIKTLIAFANTAGGTLIIGRTSGGKVIGVENVLEAEEKLANVIADSIYPPLTPEIEITSLEGRSLLIIRVPYWRGPFYFKAEGKERGVYIRLGSTNRAADQAFLAELERIAAKVSYDQLPCPEVDDSGLDWSRLEEAFDKMGKNVDIELLETLNILVPYSGRLVCSNGGVILFGKEDCRRRLFSNTEMRCARFQGEEKVEFIDRYDFSGTILEAVFEVPKFIKRNSRLAASIEKIKREDIPEYSPIIIREILANALVHADYSIKGMNPRVMIFSNRLEIESPGMLPFGYTLTDFYAGVSHIRNKVIARVFRELGIIEEWGTGFRRIQEVCQGSLYPLPRWEEYGNILKVVLEPHDRTLVKKERQNALGSSDLSMRQKVILSLLKEKEILTVKEIQKQLKTSSSERTIRNDLNALKKIGVIRMVGRGPSSQWEYCAAF